MLLEFLGYAVKPEKVAAFKNYLLPILEDHDLLDLEDNEAGECICHVIQQTCDACQAGFLVDEIRDVMDGSLENKLIAAVRESRAGRTPVFEKVTTQISPASANYLIYMSEGG